MTNRISHINEEKLNSIIDNYEENYYIFNGKISDEIFKWNAAKCFRDEWFNPNNSGIPFSEMFKKARSESSWVLDNSRVSPTNGILKLAEKYEAEVSNLFYNVLLADDNGNLEIRQQNMDIFLEQIEVLRQEAFPKYWKYKQDRHTASCYLAFINPGDNYIYRYSDAEEMAKHIDFGLDIGSGETFSLANYYIMCDEIVEVLRSRDSLLEKHFDLIDSRGYYRDDSLHLLAFDLMYSSRSYNFYNDIDFTSKKERLSAFQLKKEEAEEAARREEERNKLQDEIKSLKLKASEYEDISLLNVEVYQNKYGSGTVIEQNGSRITVRFNGIEKSFILNTKYSQRPIFEDDDQIVAMYTEYDDTIKKIKELEKKI